MQAVRTRDNHLMLLARIKAGASTCVRRKVGCVLVGFDNRILAITHNEVPVTRYACEGFKVCDGSNLAPGKDFCEGLHAEQIAITQVNAQEIYACYLTVSPCRSCTKLLLATSCQVIVFEENFVDEFAEKMWKANGREWRPLH